MLSWLVGMDSRLKIKVCGLTSERDVDLALAAGADYFGFITYAPSPRAVSVQRAYELAARVPAGQRVVVDVASTPEQLECYRDAGFDRFQIHVELSMAEASLRTWSDLVGADRLWLAPRLKSGESVPDSWFGHAESFLVDTYSKGQVGGTGQTGDWAQFAELRVATPAVQWILAGGLHAGNVHAALAATGARHIDVNSGVESSPGVKDPRKMSELFQVLLAMH
ncbi:MAG: phosphoribosylanthranilate isomerase [Lentimonas sp.]|jgi:phosphoribosylanthranilate isomerase